MTACSVSVYPCNRSTYGSDASNRATMRNVAFTRWDPLRDLLALHEQLGHLVGTDAPGWTPPVDLYETAGEYVLTAELPGLAGEQIDIPCEQFHRVERGHGRFSRAFALPEIIDVEAITADLKDGILTITIPKAADRGARRIDVS